jgi:NitT/TauT family transport system substrate-binding protein
MVRQITRRTLIVAAGATVLAAPYVARAQAALTRVRFTSSWALQGDISFLVLGKEKGFFRDAGVDLVINRGFGSGRVPVDIAAGTYDIGEGDINPVLKFMAEKPERGLVVAGVLADSSPLAAITHSDGPIKKPKDLEGRTLAAPEFDAGRQMFPAFARAAGIDASKVNWMSVSPELREPMLVQKRSDGITGFVTSASLSLKALGMDWPKQHLMFYKDYGLDLYSGAYTTTREFASKHPEAVRGTIAAVIRSYIYAYKNPDESIQALKKAEPLTDVAIEKERLETHHKYMGITEHVRRNGISTVDSARLQRGIEAIELSFGLKTSLKAADAYTDAFLPPRDQRML